MEVDTKPADTKPTDAQAASAPASEVDTYNTRLQRLKTILTAETPIHLNLEFLYHNNHTDMAILKNIKNAVETRNSVCHTATIFANAVMHAGLCISNLSRVFVVFFFICCVFLYLLCIFVCCVYLFVVYICLLCIFVCCVYVFVVYICLLCMCLLCNFVCCVYLFVVYLFAACYLVFSVYVLSTINPS
jgi:hypothetical protein